jgi:hypothetical protein
MSPDLNPRYLNYARQHGRTAAEQIIADRKQSPGQSGASFIKWGDARLAEFRKVAPDAFASGRLIDNAAYDVWLTSYVNIMRGIEQANSNRA